MSAARTAIASRGYTGATMEQIAKLARVGKDTLYRRWSSKEALALDLVDTLARDAVRPAPIDPDPRFNLYMFTKDIVRLYRTTDFGALVAGMVGEAARNEEFARRFAEFWERRRAIAASLVRDVVGDETPDREVQAHLDRLLGPIWYRLLLSHAEVTDEYLWDLVVDIPWAKNQTAFTEGHESPETDAGDEFADVSH